jgi:hypothetical protein
VFHVLGYQGSSHDVTNLDATPIQDDIFTVQNGHFLPSMDLNLYGGYFGGTILNNTQLVTPTTRQISIPRMIPVSATVSPPTDPNVIDMRLNPLRLRAVEEISLLNTLGTNASNLQFINILFVGTSLDPVPAGDILTLHGTATTTAVALGWTSLNTIYDTTLPNGTYAIIGAQVISTTAIAHRFIFKDQIFRPGFISTTGVANRTAWDYYRGAMGRLGTFTTTTYPILQTLCVSADTTHDVTYFIVRVA